jgi:hypothetical protein
MFTSRLFVILSEKLTYIIYIPCIYSSCGFHSLRSQRMNECEDIILMGVSWLSLFENLIVA